MNEPVIANFVQYIRLFIHEILHQNPNSGRDIWEFECLSCSFEFSQAMVQRYVMHKENQDELQKG